MRGYEANVVGIGKADPLDNMVVEAEGSLVRVTGVILVEPPIIAGEGFNKAVLGQDADSRDAIDFKPNLTLEHSYSTDRVSVFIASARTREDWMAVHNLAAMASSIIRLANMPEDVLDSMNRDKHFYPARPVVQEELSPAS